MATKGSEGSELSGMNQNQILDLCATVREISLAAHRFLRHGHSEKIYENSLANRLRKRGLNVRPQHPISVYDEDGTLVSLLWPFLLARFGFMLLWLPGSRVQAKLNTLFNFH